MAQSPVAVSTFYWDQKPVTGASGSRECSRCAREESLDVFTAVLAQKPCLIILVVVNHGIKVRSNHSTHQITTPKQASLFKGLKRL